MQVQHLLRTFVRAVARPGAVDRATLLQCMIRLEEALSARRAAAQAGDARPLSLTPPQLAALMQACLAVPRDVWLITGSAVQTLVLDQARASLPDGTIS